MTELRGTPMAVDCPSCDERITIWVHFDVKGDQREPWRLEDNQMKFYSAWKMEVQFPDFEELWTHLSGAHGLLRVANPKGVLDD